MSTDKVLRMKFFVLLSTVAVYTIADLDLKGLTVWTGVLTSGPLPVEQV